MLKLEFKSKNKRGIPFSDIEEIFDRTEVRDTPLVRKFIQEIEQGEYISPRFFKGRYGGELSTTCLSTGCKAAIILALGYKDTLDLTECGHNAINKILKNCSHGKVILDRPYPFSWSTKTSNDDSCSIEFDGHKFTGLNSLYYYINDEWDDI